MFTARKQDASLFVLFFKSSATGLLYLICVLHSWPSLTLLAMDVEPMSRSKLLPNPQHSRYLQNHVSLNSAANPIFGKLLSWELTPALRAQSAAAVSTSALAVWSISSHWFRLQEPYTIQARPMSSSKAARSSGLRCSSGCSSCHALLQFLKAWLDWTEICCHEVMKAKISALCSLHLWAHAWTDAVVDEFVATQKLLVPFLILTR